jgi:uncharacterized membrane protein
MLRSILDQMSFLVFFFTFLDLFQWPGEPGLHFSSISKETMKMKSRSSLILKCNNTFGTLFKYLLIKQSIAIKRLQTKVATMLTKFDGNSRP